MSFFLPASESGRSQQLTLHYYGLLYDDSRRSSSSHVRTSVTSFSVISERVQKA